MKVDINIKLLMGNSRILRRQIHLLKAIDTTKSITEAAREVGISYKNAWDSLNEINNIADEPLIVRTSGNRKNSGSELSAYGRGLVATYERLREVQAEVLERVCQGGRLENYDESAARELFKVGLQISVANQLRCRVTGIVQDEIFALIEGVLVGGAGAKFAGAAGAGAKFGANSNLGAGGAGFAGFAGFAGGAMSRSLAQIRIWARAARVLRVLLAGLGLAGVAMLRARAAARSC